MFWVRTQCSDISNWRFEVDSEGIFQVVKHWSGDFTSWTCNFLTQGVDLIFNRNEELLDHEDWANKKQLDIQIEGTEHGDLCNKNIAPLTDAKEMCISPAKTSIFPTAVWELFMEIVPINVSTDGLPSCYSYHRWIVGTWRPHMYLFRRPE